MAVVLTPQHRRIYDRHLQREWQRVLGLLDDVQRNRFVIFRLLTLLRQLSLDPALVDPDLSLWCSTTNASTSSRASSTTGR